MTSVRLGEELPSPDLQGSLLNNPTTPLGPLRTGVTKILSPETETPTAPLKVLQQMGNLQSMGEGFRAGAATL